MRHLWVCLFWALMVLPASAQNSAQDSVTTDRMVSAFDAWMQRNGAKSGTLAIRFQGAPVLQHGVGVAAKTPMEMASLSKAITGVCVAELVRAGRLAYDDRFVDLVGRGPLVTVAQLLKQDSGLKQDATQDIMLANVGDAADLAGDVLDAILTRGGPQKKPGRHFRYNNENYALLSLVIEAVTNADYETVCTELVLKPAGVKPVQSDVSHGFLSWGGWKMAADDYAAFLTHWFRDKTPLGRDPFALPHAHVEGGVYYGTGMFFRTFRGGHNFWHHGALCFPGRFNVGSFAVSWKGDWSAVATYDFCLDGNAMLSLDQSLSGAVFQ